MAPGQPPPPQTLADLKSYSMVKCLAFWTLGCHGLFLCQSTVRLNLQHGSHGTWLRAADTRWLGLSQTESLQLMFGDGFPSPTNIQLLHKETGFLLIV